LDRSWTERSTTGTKPKMAPIGEVGLVNGRVLCYAATEEFPEVSQDNP